MDTGAYSTGILDTLAKTLKLPFLEGRTQSGIAGEAIGSVYKAKTVVFGGKIAQKDVAMVGLNRVGSQEDGTVAAGFLTSLPSELDYGLSEIRIYVKGSMDLGSYVPIKSYINGESRESSPQIYVFATIDGIALRLLVDTGAPSSLELFPAVVKAHGLWDKYPDAKASKASGVTGASMAAREVVMSDFTLSDIAIPHMPVKLMDPDGHQEHMGVDGLLGAGFLKMFCVAITHRGIALRPNAQTVVSAAASSATASSPASQP
jgi:hypothetical protein